MEQMAGSIVIVVVGAALVLSVLGGVAYFKIATTILNLINRRKR